jgi:hypothetical protein
MGQPVLRFRRRLENPIGGDLLRVEPNERDQGKESRKPDSHD